MLNLTRETDKAVKIRSGDDVDPTTPVDETFADGPIVLEDALAAEQRQVENRRAGEALAEATSILEQTKPTVSAHSPPAIPTAQGPHRDSPPPVQFSLHAAACRRIRNPDQPRRILGPTAPPPEQER